LLNKEELLVFEHDFQVDACFLLAVHAVFTMHAIFTIESFGWVDCKNIVHMMINFKKMLS
jgi:hypothetical protein